MVRTSVVNVVVTAALGEKLDLDDLGKCPQILHDAQTYGGPDRTRTGDLLHVKQMS
jgi:hypothetical protein